jgi:azurin
MRSHRPVPARLSRRRLLLGCLAILLTVAGCRRKRTPAQQVVELFIESDGDFLAYRPDTLTCPSGAMVRLTFHHGGKFLSARHNWVLVYPGQMEAVDKDVEHNEGIVSKGDRRVIGVTPMCDKGVTVMTQFTAPAPGDYPFFCSTPGHGECMNGILHVTA